MLNIIKKGGIALTTLSVITLMTGCGIDNTGANTVGNNFVSAEIVEDINASTMLTIVKGSIDANATNAFGYKAVKITYNTKGQNDEDIIASGLLVIPSASDAYNEYRISQGEGPFTISMICDNHGTIFTNAEAPTNVEKSDGIPNYPLAVSMTAYAGFAAVLPDYIGYGESNDVYHPYMLKKASTRDSLDMIKASTRYMTDNNILFNGQLFVSGYSQGGYNAMALAQEIETNHSDEFTLKGVAPMAGPYLLDAFGDAVLKEGAIMSVPAFMAYLADSYANGYSDISLEEMIQENKIDAFDGLFDGSNDIVAIHTKLLMGLASPSNLLFKGSFINDYETTPHHKLRERFKENDVVQWKANSKIKLIHCSNDDVIPVDMTYGAEAFLNNYGSKNISKTIIDSVIADYALGESVHSNCAPSAYGVAIKWFSELRVGE